MEFDDDQKHQTWANVTNGSHAHLAFSHLIENDFCLLFHKRGTKNIGDSTSRWSKKLLKFLMVEMKKV